MCTRTVTPLPPSALPRAHVSPDACPVCHGAGRLPAMTVVGLTNPCPRCANALKPAANRVAKAEEQDGASRNAGRRATDQDPVPGLLLIACGALCGAISALLLVGIFRVFG